MRNTFDGFDAKTVTPEESTNIDTLVQQDLQKHLNK